MKSLSGFRDFYPGEAAWRQAVLATWRGVAGRHGFSEYDGPTVEPLDLYAKKNAGGEEIFGQIYRFTDGGGREVALRPEMTPTLARMVGAAEKHYRKPLKWFSIGNFFRFERQQKGRLREFIQLNCDILGETGASADAELIALAIDVLRAFGLSSSDFVVRISHRGAWAAFLEERGLDAQATRGVLQVADKLERETPEALDAKLKPFGLTVGDLRAFVAGPPPDDLRAVLENLEARGLGGYITADLSIVRGLAYYTGVVFEVFDRQRELRALAGGGRYDGLVGALSGVDIPAAGFGMGDVVLGKFIESIPVALQKMRERMAAASALDVFVVVAEEAHRPGSLGLLQRLRDAGLSADMSLEPARVGRQFQMAESANAVHAVVIGAEWPQVRTKRMATREESTIPHGELVEWLKSQQVSRS